MVVNGKGKIRRLEAFEMWCNRKLLDTVEGRKRKWR